MATNESTNESTTDAKRFMDDVDSKPELRSKLRGALDHILKTAKEHGYNVSEQDMREELRKRWGVTNPPGYESEPDTCTFI